MSMRHTLALAAAISAAALAAACGSSHPAAPNGQGGTGGQGGAAGADAGLAGSDAGASKCGPIDAANAVPAGSPLAQGQFDFLCNAWGTEQLDSWPPADFMLQLMTSEPTVFGDQYAKFGFIPDPDDDFPIGFKRGLVDPTKVHETCAMCHVDRLPDGKLWMGAPNVSLDIGRFRVEVDKRWVAAGHPSMMTSLEQQKALELGPGRTNAETSSYPEVVPADFPPYFQLGQRTHMNYLGTGHDVRTEAYLSIYTFGAGSPDDATAKVPFPSESEADEFVQFLGSLQPPTPPAGDPTLIAQGKAVFASARCDTCHHPDDPSKLDVVTVDKGSNPMERYPGDDPAFPRGSILTDPLHLVIEDVSGSGDAGADSGADSGIDKGYAELIIFILKHHLSAGATDGYRTLSLRGLWATAPYLHNGSVPTLEDLLDPAASRPKTFKRGSFTIDTSLPGNQNVGHEFGTTLSAGDKTALVAYLKSL